MKEPLDRHLPSLQPGATGGPAGFLPPPRSVERRRLAQLVAGWFLFFFLFAPGKLFTVDSLNAAATARQILHGRSSIEKGMLTLQDSQGNEYLRHAMLWSVMLVPLDAVALGLETVLTEHAQAVLFPNGPAGVILPLANHLVTALILTLLFQFLLLLGVAPTRAFLLSASAGVSTLLLPYSRDLFRQPLAALLILVAVASLWDLRPGRERKRALQAGAALGLSIVNRYATFGFLPIFFLGFLARIYKTQDKRIWGRTLPAFLIPIGLGYVAHCFTLWLRWEDPFFNVGQEIDFSANLLKTIPYFFLSLESGLLGYCPLWIFLFWGFPALWRRGEHWLPLMIASLMVTFLVLYGSVEFYYGGVNPGPRYLLPLIPLFFLTFGALAERERSNRTFWAAWLAVSVLGAAVNGYEALTDYTQARSAGSMIMNLLMPSLDDGLPPWHFGQLFVGWWPTLFRTPGIRVVSICAFVAVSAAAFSVLRRAWLNCRLQDAGNP